MEIIQKNTENTRKNKNIREKEEKDGILTPDSQLTDTVAVATQ